MERPPELNGRDVLKGAAGLAVIGAGAAATGRDLVAGARAAGRRRERVAIVGAGAGGVAAAHFLAGTHQVELFEARGRIGGHCDSRTVEHKGSRVTVDLGAQFFHPDTHPIYVTLLEEMVSTTPSTRRPMRRSSRRGACACSPWTASTAAGARAAPGSAHCTSRCRRARPSTSSSRGRRDALPTRRRSCWSGASSTR